MRKIAVTCCLPLLFVMLVPSTICQETKKAVEPAHASTEPAHYYRLDFLIQELDAGGKVVNTRSYSATASADPNKKYDPTFIRAGSKIPVGAQYIDIGVNIDAHDVRPIGHELAMNLSAEVGSLPAASGSGESASSSTMPVIRQNKWQGTVLIPLGKATVVFSSDLLDTKGTMQVVVTARQLE